MKKIMMKKICILSLLILIGLSVWFISQRKMFEFYILLAITGVIMVMVIIVCALVIVKSGLFKEISERFAVTVCDSVVRRRISRQMDELKNRFSSVDKLYDEFADLKDEVEQSESSKENEKKLVELINRATKDIESEALVMTEEELKGKKSLIDDAEKILNEIRDDIISDEEKREKMSRIAELKPIVIKAQKEVEDFCTVQSEKLKKQIDHKSRYLISKAKRHAKKDAASGQQFSQIELDEALEILENEKGFKLAYTKESLKLLQEQFAEVQKIIKDLNDEFENVNKDR